MQEILELIKEATGIDAIPIHTESVANDTICYKDYSLSDDGVISRHRVELRIITKEYARADIIRAQLINALVTRGDDNLTQNILRGALNGGGRLFEYETNTIHTLVYFEFIKRSIKQ